MRRHSLYKTDEVFVWGDTQGVLGLQGTTGYAFDLTGELFFFLFDCGIRNPSVHFCALHYKGFNQGS